MVCDPDPWSLDATVFCAPQAESEDWLVERISKGAPGIWAHVAQGSLTRAPDRGAVRLWVAAAAAIEEVPTLAAIVQARVRYIHLINAPPGYDISHSEPRWSDRIFVSVPDRSDAVGALRLAEGVIHEAMHLHLTLFEADTPLVRDMAKVTYSPWRETERPVGGVLHGLFVFACLRTYFGWLPNTRCQAALDHLRQRCRDIEAELAKVEVDSFLSSLTDTGQALVRLLVAQTERAVLHGCCGLGSAELVTGRSDD